MRPEDRYIQTEKYGRREIQKRYEHQFQAGSLLPDILIKTPQNDIHFSYRFAGDAYANKRFEEFERAIKAKYGSDTEIKLKSKSGLCMTPNIWNHGAGQCGYPFRRVRRRELSSQQAVSGCDCEYGKAARWPGRDELRSPCKR
ncbi:VirE2 family protein [Rhizobium nepotum]|uniref:VirE2 family protein n=1 Tax=Rhizobium nepotum TaxID=1035271 RepID=UPI003CF2DB91